MSDAELKQNVRPVLNIEPPKDFKVIYLNDDVTTYEFVIESLTNIFDYETVLDLLQFNGLLYSRNFKSSSGRTI